MKTVYIFSVLASLVSYLTPCASSQQQKVEYSYTSIPGFYSERKIDGTMGPPEMKVALGTFYDSLQLAEFALTAKIGEKQLTCPLAYQDVAYLWDLSNLERRTVVILAYSGCPFQIDSELSIQKNIILRDTTTLLIDSTANDVLRLAKDSDLPFIANTTGLVSLCATAVNVVWSFRRANMLFETKSAIYITTKQAATIEFTEDGIKMDGIHKKMKKITKR